jgi:hypothetical protein
VITIIMKRTRCMAGQHYYCSTDELIFSRTPFSVPSLAQCCAKLGVVREVQQTGMPLQMNHLGDDLLAQIFKELPWRNRRAAAWTVLLSLHTL